MDQAQGIIRTIATAEDPTLVRCFRGHQKSVTSVNFSREMKQVVSGGMDGIVEVWNFKPQIRPFKFTGHKGAVNDVVFNSDSTKVISCGEDREIKIWKNSVNGKNKTVKAHSGPILKISLAESEEFLVSCSSDKTIKMWSLNGKFKQSFIGHTNWVRQCQISKDQRLLLSCSDDRSVKLWDINKAAISATFVQHKSEVLSCKFTPDGTCIAGSAVDGTIKLWDTRLGKLIQHYNAHQKAVNRIAFHPLGYHLASVSNDNKIKVWQLKQGRLGWTVHGHEGEIKSIDFNEKGDYFATGGEDKLVMVWMSNFDKEISGKGRLVESNIKEKPNGNGVQTFFKSNKHGKDNYQVSPSEKNISDSQTIIKQGKNKMNPKSEVNINLAQAIAELMSFQLEKIVNQLECITKSLDFMDRHVTEHQGVVEKLLGDERIDEAFYQMEGQGFMVPQVYNSAWEAHNETEREQDLDFVNEEEAELEKFLKEDQDKKIQFQKRMGEEDMEFFSDQIIKQDEAQ